MCDIKETLTTLANAFAHKIDPDFATAVQFYIKDAESPWHVIVDKGRQVKVQEGPCSSAQFTFTTDLATLGKIVEGRMTGMTAGAKSTGSDPAPLDIELAKGSTPDDEIRLRLYTFVQHFFNPVSPEKTLLGKEHSRLVHGGHAVPLYYHPGFRSAWYMLEKGDRLNEPGGTNPFPQAFVFIEGRGMAKIGDATIEVAGGESYYIPPESDHVVWVEEDGPLVLIWLAWGDGA